MLLLLHYVMASQLSLSLFVPFVNQPIIQDELLDFVQHAHKTSRECIRTFSCNVEFTLSFVPPNSRPSQSSSGRFWCSLEAIRVKASESNNEKLDYLWKDNVRNSVQEQVSNGKPIFAATRGRFPNRHIHRIDAWTRGLLALNVPGAIQHIPFEQLISQASKTRAVERRNVGGTEMVVVELFFDKSEDRSDPWVVEIFFDSSVNYLVRKTIYTATSAKGTLRREEEVVQFKECAPGIFFPERVIGKTSTDGKPWTTQTTIFSEIHVNQPLPSGIFDFHFPEGIYINDGIRGERYRVNAQGNQISEAVPLGRVSPPPAGIEGQIEPRTETQEEPLSWSRWIFPISLGLLILGLVVGFIKRRWKNNSAV